MLFRFEAIALAAVVVLILQVDSHDEGLVKNQDNVNEPDNPLVVVVVVAGSGDLRQTDAQHLLEHDKSDV